MPCVVRSCVMSASSPLAHRIGFGFHPRSGTPDVKQALSHADPIHRISVGGASSGDRSGTESGRRRPPFPQRFPYVVTPHPGMRVSARMPDRPHRERSCPA